MNRSSKVFVDVFNESIMAFFEILLALFAIGVGFLIIDASLIIIGPRSWRYDIAGVAAHAENNSHSRFKSRVHATLNCAQILMFLQHLPSDHTLCECCK